MFFLRKSSSHWTFFEDNHSKGFKSFYKKCKERRENQNLSSQSALEKSPRKSSELLEEATLVEEPNDEAYYDESDD